MVLLIILFEKIIIWLLKKPMPINNWTQNKKVTLYLQIQFSEAKLLNYNFILGKMIKVWNFLILSTFSIFCFYWSNTNILNKIRNSRKTKLLKWRFFLLQCIKKQYLYELTENIRGMNLNKYNKKYIFLKKILKYWTKNALLINYGISFLKISQEENNASFL